ncbi:MULTISPECIES: glycoside hydrolase family 3 N-terminal domain-containing protein [unclassified Butyrivibrio]|uniref:glycoside hydrolase family 3 N-terminal domain-containing protein n=1 Tax=unclassified Butyrivibrio TaxID=2639466 RepID=UPI0003F4C26D|nr:MULTISPECIES: glycoside hydrolase family 3 N-terminal domain-containing protein [unclassified Butyrivibrio]SDB62315.1 beta-N-acetylhexosaminidase [Butyrivibrio sp. INlla16]SEL44813.1 beta-N-acetylhexosaminidase [Butyrivibrio sp. ob235]
MEDKMNISNGSERDVRRELRRQRRIKAQVTAYVITGVLGVSVVSAAFLGVNSIVKAVKDYNASVEEAVAEAKQVGAEQAAVASPEENITESEVQSTDAMLDNIVDTCISEMPLEDRVAGLFMVSPEQLTGSDAVVKAGTATQDALSQYAVGGLFYVTKNIKDEAQIKDMLSSTASMSKYPLFISTTEVGGEKSLVANGLGLDPVASPTELGASGNADEAYNTASRVADYLNAYGFNLNVGVNANLTDSGTSFGTDPQNVSAMVAKTVEGLQSFGVSAGLQYFPETINSGNSIEGLQDALSPFRAGIDAGASMIMVCTAPSMGITGDETPSCLSSVVVQDLLRGQLGFDGIIITDSLSDLADRYSSADAAVAAIQAGADMIFLPADFVDAYQGVLAAVQNGTISEERINESLRRVYRVKYANRVEEITSGQ